MIISINMMQAEKPELQSNEQPEKAVRQRWTRILLLPALFIIILTLAVGLDYYRYHGRIYPHVYLEEVSIGGLHFAEAENKLDSKLWSLKTIRLGGLENEESRVSLYDLGISWDRKAAMLEIREKASGRHGYPGRLRRILSRAPLHLKGTITVETDRLRSFLEKVAHLAEREPQDARFVVRGTEVLIEEEISGRSVQVESLRKRLLDAVRTGRDRVIIPVVLKQPALTENILADYKVDRVMISFSTDVSSAIPNRVHNIILGAEAINGCLLQPGDIFSFEAVVGDSTREKGYREAPVIVGGRLVPGLGGGLCQVSSTLYNAALLANLDIVERYSHSLTIGYLPVGRDATISIGHADLKFKNTRDHPILVGAELKDGTLTFSLFGPPMEERVELISSDIVRLEPPVHYEKSGALPEGTLELLEKGKAGYRVKTWRVVYSGSKEISRELISHDHYRPVPTVYRIGTAEW